MKLAFGLLAVGVICGALLSDAWLFIVPATLAAAVALACGLRARNWRRAGSAALCGAVLVSAGHMLAHHQRALSNQAHVQTMLDMYANRQKAVRTAPVRADLYSPVPIGGSL